MNDLEDRVRTALRTHAEDFTASPDAWERTTARVPRARLARFRRSPARGPLGRLAAGGFAPLAAAAAMVAVAVTVTTIAGIAGRPWGPGSGGSTASRGNAATTVMAPPPGMRRVPPGTAMVEQAYAGQVSWTDFWFMGRGKARQMCEETASKSADAQKTGKTPTEAAPIYPIYLWPSRCGHVGLQHGGLVSWVYELNLTKNASISVGIAARQVASVTTVLPGGLRVRGVVTSGRGFPYKVWVVSYPPRYAGHATLVFRNAAGHEVAHLTGK